MLHLHVLAQTLILVHALVSATYVQYIHDQGFFYKLPMLFHCAIPEQLLSKRGTGGDCVK